MIEYLDKIPFPTSYFILDRSGRKYKSIDSWIDYHKRISGNKHYKKKFGKVAPYVIIQNTSIKDDISIYFHDVEITDELLTKFIINSDFIKLYFSKDFSKIVFIEFSYGLNSSYIDPEYYYGGKRLDLLKSYKTSYAKGWSNSPYIATVSYSMRNNVTAGNSIVLAYILSSYDYVDTEYGRYLDFCELSCNCFGCVPMYYIEEYTGKRVNGNKRYRIMYSCDLGNRIHGFYEYVEAESIKDAKKVFNEQIKEWVGVKNLYLICIEQLAATQWF